MNKAFLLNKNYFIIEIDEKEYKFSRTKSFHSLSSDHVRVEDTVTRISVSILKNQIQSIKDTESEEQFNLI
ncbi:hypothetical protein [Tenacibaculum phage Larrie]|nr:hypothetical protein [Tenacibaculum phage Larrie]